MATAEVFKYINLRATRNLDTRIEVGLDTIRIGYFPHPVSWRLVDETGR